MKCFKAATFYTPTLCTMPRGQSKHSRIGTFACHSNSSRTSKASKRANLPTRDKRTINNRRLNDFKSKSTKADYTSPS
ncbi:MAG: hypothetical protein JNM57_16250 [Cyclobacteriaceae bacterium]|nr:hypothetical protein [Cyclobacteriaceae bacterium]